MERRPPKTNQIIDSAGGGWAGCFHHGLHVIYWVYEKRLNSRRRDARRQKKQKTANKFHCVGFIYCCSVFIQTILCATIIRRQVPPRDEFIGESNLHQKNYGVRRR